MSTAPPPSAAPPKAPAPVTEAVVAAAAAAAAVAAAPVNRSVDFDFRRPDPRKLPNNLVRAAVDSTSLSQARNQA